MVEPADWLSGDHRIEGVLAAAGPHGRPRPAFPQTVVQLVDLAPTILAAAGAPASVRHSGTVLRRWSARIAALARRLGAGGGALARRGRRASTTSEAEEVEEHLRGLGYLE